MLVKDALSAGAKKGDALCAAARAVHGEPTVSAAP
jgi:hypothetical protein